jgi:stearoyl-CoA desaturase (delta-9 desaturase)
VNQTTAAEYHDDIIYPGTIPFVLVHLTCLAAIWTGVTRTAVTIAIGLFLLRMLAVTAGYHRYFSHRSFKTSRTFQFVLAFIAQSSTQQGALWWAAKHRRHSDTELDVHSPRQRGFWFSHVGWIFSRSQKNADYSLVPDLMRYPELRWLDRHHRIPGFALAVACLAVGGWPGLIVGFFWSTTVLYHCTFFINSLAHVVGNQRYVTGDDSRNNWWLAILTFGEGWHNNHHHYQASTRQGFRWWEIDVTFYVLKVLSWTGLVWDLKAPPEEVVRGEKPLPRPVVEKVAHQLAASFSTASISDRIRDAWREKPSLAELRARATQARAQAEALLARIQLPEVHFPDVHFPEVHFPDVSAASLEDLRRRAQEARARAEALLREVELPAMPSLDELKRRAREMYAASPSLDDVVERARQILVTAVSNELLGRPLPSPA